MHGYGRGLVVSAAACVLVVFAVGSASAAKPVLSGGRAKAPLCDRSATGWPAYHWPVKPFDRQHPIRGAFGDPRTLVTGDLFGQTGPGLAGAYSFHNGVDIVAAPGTAVYPVVSGRVVVRSQDKIVVRTDDGRAFQYMHLDGAVHLGQTVVAERTILGWIRPGTVFEHVHLGEIDAGPDGLCRIHNPLDPGHLEPYQDHTTPRATGLYLDNGHGPYPIDGPIRPQDRLVVAAADPPASRLPGGWFGLPQAPALVEWRLLHAGAYTPWRVVVDFRTTEPPPRDFWSVYAPGTYQNRFGTPGRYLFRLDLNPAGLQPGHYQLEVQVADIRNNHSTAAWSLQIASGARVTPSALPLPAPQPFRPGQINRYLKETPRPLHSDRTPAGR